VQRIEIDKTGEGRCSDAGERTARRAHQAACEAL
jgi:hypothetical protein